MFLDRKPFLSWRTPLTVPIYILPLRVREKIFNEREKEFIISMFVTRYQFSLLLFFLEIKIFLEEKRIDKERFLQFKSLALSLPLQ